MRILFRIMRALRPYYPQAALMVACVLVVTAASLVVPGIIQTVIDQGLQQGDVAVMARAGLTIIGVGLIRSLFNFGKRYISEWLINRTGYDFRNALYDKIQRLPFDYHDRTATGQLMSRCTEDVGALSRFVGQGSVELLNVALLLAGIIVLLFRESVTLTLIGLGPLILLGLMTIFMARIIDPMFLRID